MGYCRHRIGSRCRNVHHQHCRHPADSGRARTVEPYFQKHWHEKFRDNLSTSSKEILPQVSRRFNSKDYLVVSYNLDRQVQGEYTNYQVTMVIKSKKSYDEGYLLQLMQEFPEVTVEKIE